MHSRQRDVAYAYTKAAQHFNCGKYEGEMRSQFSCLVRPQHKSSGAEGAQEVLASREASSQQQQVCMS